MKAYETFETERLILRASSIEDAAFIFKLMNTEQWKTNIGDRKVYTEADAQKYIKEKMIPQYLRMGFGNYTVIRKEDGAKMGSCGLYDRESLEGLDIGFAFLPEYQKKGYALESALRIRNAAFEELGISKLSAITIEANKASQNLLEKLGFKFVKMINIPNDKEELMYYELNQ